MSKTQAAALTDRSLFHGNPWNERNAEGQAYFEVIPLLVALRGRGELHDLVGNDAVADFVSDSGSVDCWCSKHYI